MICKSPFWFGRILEVEMSLEEILKQTRQQRVVVQDLAFCIMDQQCDPFDLVDDLELLEDVTRDEWSVLLAAVSFRSKVMVQLGQASQALGLLDEVEMLWWAREECVSNILCGLGIPMLGDPVVEVPTAA